MNNVKIIISLLLISNICLGEAPTYQFKFNSGEKAIKEPSNKVKNKSPSNKKAKNSMSGWGLSYILAEVVSESINSKWSFGSPADRKLKYTRNIFAIHAPITHSFAIITGLEISNLYYQAEKNKATGLYLGLENNFHIVKNFYISGNLGVHYLFDVSSSDNNQNIYSYDDTYDASKTFEIGIKPNLRFKHFGIGLNFSAGRTALSQKDIYSNKENIYSDTFSGALNLSFFL